MLPEPALLFAGLIFGVLGIYVFKEGRRLSNVGKILIGVILMVYPYFFTSATLTWIVGIVLFAASFKL